MDFATTFWDYFTLEYLRSGLLLLLWSVVPVALSLLLYLLNGRCAFDKKRPLLWQVCVGVLFGGVAVLNNEFGVNIGIAVMNVRDAAPLCAGFLFGPVSGIIAGLIGGIERWFCVYWTYAQYSQLACSVSTAFAGFYAALLRKYFFDEKRPGKLMGFTVGALMEVFHMMMVYFTHMDDPVQALYVIRACTVPMTLLNALSLMSSIAVADGIDLRRERLAMGELRAQTLKRNKPTRQQRREQTPISRQVQIRLSVAVTVAFCISALSFFILENNTVMDNAESTLDQGLYSLAFDISDESDESCLKSARLVAAELEKNPDADLADLCSRYNASEIYVVDENGIIVRTSDKYLGLDLHTVTRVEYGEVLPNAFMCLLDDDDTNATELVQPFQTVGMDSDVERKLAAVCLSSGGFVQIAQDYDIVASDIMDQLRILTYNRVVGDSGFFLAADSDFYVISNDSYINEAPLSEYIPDLDVWEAENKMVKVHFYETAYYCKTYYNEGIVLIALTYESDVLATRDTAFYFSLFLQIIVYAVLFFVLYLLVRNTVVKKIFRVNTHLEAIIGGDLDTVVDVRSAKEFTLLSDDINSTVTTLKNYIAEAAGRIDRELAFARQIQQSALPSVFPPYPGRKDFSLFAVMDAAKEVGGDFYDFFFVAENKLAVLIADVSGKGIPAAMFMMNAKTTIKNLAERGLPVNDVMTLANERLCANNETGMFVTAWMGIVDLTTGHVSFANAGHNPPYIIRNGLGVNMLKSRAGFVLGGMEGIRYREQSFDLAPGERLFLYTDGVTEAINPAEELFGEKRLEEALEKHRTLPAEKLLPCLRQEVSLYAGEAEQADDITMLVFDYHGNPKELTVPAKAEHTDEVRLFMESVLEEAGAKPKAATQILIAADEIVSNVMKFAYPGGEGNLTVTMQAEDTLYSVKFTDSGIPFDPLNIPEPDITLPAEKRKIGGLGIFIVKKTMDDATYARVEDRNELTLRKDIWR